MVKDMDKPPYCEVAAIPIPVSAIVEVITHAHTRERKARGRKHRHGLLPSPSVFEGWGLADQPAKWPPKQCSD